MAAGAMPREMIGAEGLGGNARASRLRRASLEVNPCLERSDHAENVYFPVSARFPAWIGRVCLIASVASRLRGLHQINTTDYDPSRQIRPSDHRPAHLHHGPLQFPLRLLPLRRPRKLPRSR